MTRRFQPSAESLGAAGSGGFGAAGSGGFGAAGSGGFGAEAAPAVSMDSSMQSLVAQYGPTVAALVAGGRDARERLALVEARIQNYQRLKDTPPFSIVPGRAWYTAEIARMQAILPALRAQAQETAHIAAAKTSVAGLTQGALVGVVAVSAALTALLFSLTARTTVTTVRHARGLPIPVDGPTGAYAGSMSYPPAQHLLPGPR